MCVCNFILLCMHVDRKKIRRKNECKIRKSTQQKCHSMWSFRVFLRWWTIQRCPFYIQLWQQPSSLTLFSCFVWYLSVSELFVFPSTNIWHKWFVVWDKTTDDFFSRTNERREKNHASVNQWTMTTQNGPKTVSIQCENFIVYAQNIEWAAFSS